MSARLFVGSLPPSVDDATLRDTFAPHGEVLDAAVITERGSRRSRGFGFVTLKTEGGARAAREALDGERIRGRKLRVKKAKPRKRRGGAPRRRDDGLTRGYPMPGGW